MKTSLKAGFAQIFSCCPKNLSCPKFGGAAAPLAPPGPYAYALFSYFKRAMGVVAKKSSVLVLGHFTSLILSTATLNFNYKNVFQALYSITRFLRQTHDA